MLSRRRGSPSRHPGENRFAYFRIFQTVFGLLVVALVILELSLFVERNLDPGAIVSMTDDSSDYANSIPTQALFQQHLQKSKISSSSSAAEAADANTNYKRITRPKTSIRIQQQNTNPGTISAMTFGTTNDRREPKIAYAISVTSCLPNSTSVLDGAAVLGHSIHLASARVNNNSRYDYALYAFVHVDAKSCAPILTQLGYTVLLKEGPPFRVEDIQNEQLQRQIELKGCCGSKEFLKLYAYSLVEHPIVVHFDTDVVVLQPLDQLFDTILGDEYSKKQLPSEHVMGNNTLDKTRIADFYFTRDYLQGSQYTNDPQQYGVQGGFFAVLPNTTMLKELSQRLLTEQFTTTRGWSKKGHHGYWGATQIQGFLSYVYGEYYPDRAIELNRCLYNSMINDDPYHSKTGHCRTRQAICQDCRETPMDQIHTIHLTTCRKPWECPFLRAPQPLLCREAHKAWFEIRRSLEKSWNQEPPQNGWKREWTLGYCKKVTARVRYYVPLVLPNATPILVGQ
jgi:lipopolysaccharide biosynthesis glycosyltransferase